MKTYNLLRQYQQYLLYALPFLMAVIMVFFRHGTYWIILAATLYCWTPNSLSYRSFLPTLHEHVISKLLMAAIFSVFIISNITLSEMPQASAAEFMKFFLMLILMVLVSHILHKTRDWQIYQLTRAMIFGLFCAGICVFLFIATDAHLIFNGRYTGMKQNVEVFTLFLAPALCYLLDKRRPAVMLLLLIMGMLLCIRTHLQAGYFGILVGSLMAVASLRHARWLGIFLPVLSTLYYVSFPAVMALIPLSLTHSIPHKIFLCIETFIHRLYIWKNLTPLIKERFIIGHGFAVSRYFKGNSLEMPFDNWSALPSHPHNIVMQLWFEFGLAGVLLVLSLTFWGLRRISTIASRGTRALVYFYVGQTWVTLSLSHSLWHKWWICWMAFSGILLYRQARLLPASTATKDLSTDPAARYS